jgi:hypothetical protein
LLALAKQPLYHLSHTSVHFVLVILEMGVLWTICPGWPRIGILLTSAWQETGITGMSHLALSQGIQITFKCLHILFNFLQWQVLHFYLWKCNFFFIQQEV